MSTTETTEWAGPTRFLPPPAPLLADGVRRYVGVTYAAVPGFRPLQLDLWVPDTDATPPLVVWIHGGAWLFGDRRYLPETLRPDSLFEELVAAGLAVATVDYRHSLEAPFPAQLHDVKAAVRYLRAHAAELGISTGRVGVMGESAGGYLAAMLGLTGSRADLEGSEGVVSTSSAVDAVVDWYGPTDMSTMPRRTPPPPIAAMLPPELHLAPEDLLLLGLDESAQADASPFTHVAADAPPFLLVHGTADALVPFSQSEVLSDALTRAGASARLVPVQDADHIFLGHPDVDSLLRLSVQFLADQLLGPAE